MQNYQISPGNIEGRVLPDPHLEIWESNRTHRIRTLFWAKRTETNEPNVISWPNRTEPNCQTIRTEANLNFVARVRFPCQWSLHSVQCIQACDVFVSVSYLSILIVKDHQTVEPNAKYTCTAKRFYVTDILKLNLDKTGQIEVSNWSESWPWPNRNRTFVNGFDSHHYPHPKGTGSQRSPVLGFLSIWPVRNTLCRRKGLIVLRGRSATPPRSYLIGHPSDPKFLGSLLFMRTPFVAELPTLMW